jgi:hypothetical protein
MSIHLIPGFMATIAVLRPYDPAEQVLVVVDADASWRLILNLARALLRHAERRELARVLLTH